MVKDRTDEGLLTTNQLAKLLKLAASTLTSMRSRGGGPGFIVLGHCVYYAIEDVQNWFKANNIDATNWPKNRQIKRLRS